MSELSGVPGELRATIHIVRKETGKVEEYEVIGHSDPAVLEKILDEKKEQDHERNP